ncbi:hypothetical protein CPB83DRAFT_896190 [Crepidotus variabilis]|uniref:Uncharacterized protein n=1 Tax=Crepidotus variabilis TaxID=179855 RepID=A0A9P6JN61_9AGAR|nr:hypothetical protein CPB83DRAFT_896190 [Crepidotus variabilis]
MKEAISKRNRILKPKKALLLAFGQDYEAQVSAIRTDITKLSSYDAPILRLDSDILKHPCVYYHDQKDIGVSDKFFMFRFQSPPNPAHPEELEVENVAALALIHELTHASFGAVDHYRADLTPVNALDGHKPDDLLGYLLKDYKKLREKAGAALMIKNADSYLLFAHLAVTGDVDISPLYPKSLWDA